MTTRTLFILPAALLLAAMAAPVSAQLVAQIGNETTAPSAVSMTPIYRSSPSSAFDYSIQQTMYPASVLGIPAGAEIVGIEYHKTDTFGSSVAEHTLQVWLSETTATSYVNDTFGNATAGATLMFDSTTYGMPATSGWIDFGPFNQATPFIYTGGNLEVTVNWDCSITAGNPTTGAFSWSYEAYAGGLARGYSSGTAPTAATNLSTTTNQSNARYPVVRIYWIPPTGDVNVLQNNSPPGDVLPASATDLVVMDLTAQTFNTSQDINSMTFSASGHFQDANLSNVKLVADNNDDGIVDAGDTVLGQGTLTNGQISFSGAPLVAVPTTGGPRMLLAVSYSAGVLGNGYSIAFEIAQATDVVWSGGSDLGNYPMPSGNWTTPTGSFPMLAEYGNQATGNAFPFNYSTGSGRFQSAYDATELGWTAGTLVGEIWVAGSIVSPPEYGNLRLRIAHTNVTVNALTTDFDTNYTGSLTTVLGPTNYTPGTADIPTSTSVQWYIYTFSQPFVYNGTDGILVDWSYDSRVGVGYTISTSSSVTPPELVRSRVYLNGGGYDSTTASAASTTGGNYGIRFNEMPSNAVAIANSGGATGLNTPGQDIIMLDLTATAIGNPQTLSEITFTRRGSVTDAQVDEVKLVLDDNDNGAIDATDTVLGTGVFVNDQVTFPFSPAINIPEVTTGPSPRMLLAVTIGQRLTVGESLEVSIDFLSDAVFSGGDNLTTFPVSSGQIVQALAGLFTINQTSGDFADIGDAFDALESFGVSGPVDLVITDSATYTATEAYSLGIDDTFNANLPVEGATATNRITLRVAAGETPVVQGSATGAGLRGFSGRGAIGIMQSHVTIEGLRITGGPNFGIYIQGNGTASVGLTPSDVTVRRCMVHDIPDGPGIAFLGQNSARFTDGLFEHNFVWNCHTNSIPLTSEVQASTSTAGCIAMRNTDPASTIIRHNTVLHTSSVANTAGIAFSNASGSVPHFELTNNIVIVTDPATFAIRIQAAGDAPDPNNTDFNYWFATTHSNQTTMATFALWQGLGNDTNGSDADPQLVDTAGPNYDLRLSATSPAIDPAGQTSAATEDIFGNLRPLGATVDIGAHEFGDPGDMYVEFNSAAVTLNGIVNVGDARHTAGDTFTFTIGNNGPGDLVLTGTPEVEFFLGDNLEVSTDVQTPPAVTVIPATSSTTFTLYIEPTTVGPFDLFVSIPNGDGSKNPFAFTIEGMGIIPNAPAIADVPGNSNFGGGVNGPFSKAIDPGDALTAATIELTDADADNITVNFITPRGTAPTGITAPSIPSPGQPLLLEWTGTADASNAPGDYIWDIEFVDAVNGTPVAIEVTIHINDLAPQHAIADADSGDGTAGNPYATTFVVGDDSSVSVDAVAVTDPNTAQALSIDNVLPGTAPFDFTLAGGLLTLNPTATLTSAEAGLHQFTVTVTDGTHLETFVVEVLVYDASGAITFTTATVMPSGIINQPYAGLIEVTGATGTVTFQLIGGALPNGLSFNGTTGAISGTPLTEETASFTIRAFDAANDTATETFEITIGPVPPPPSGSSSSSSGGCAGADGSNVGLLALLAATSVLALAARRRKLRA